MLLKAIWRFKILHRHLKLFQGWPSSKKRQGSHRELLCRHTETFVISVEDKWLSGLPGSCLGPRDVPCCRSEINLVIFFQLIHFGTNSHLKLIPKWSLNKNLTFFQFRVLHSKMWAHILLDFSRSFLKKIAKRSSFYGRVAITSCWLNWYQVKRERRVPGVQVGFGELR